MPLVGPSSPSLLVSVVSSGAPGGVELNVPVIHLVAGLLRHVHGNTTKTMNCRKFDITKLEVLKMAIGQQ